MALIDEPKTPGVFTTWSIRNFSRCMSEENEYLYSPSFYFGSIKLRLKLYPKGNESPGFASLYLMQTDSAENCPANNTFKYVLAFQKCNGLVNESIEFGNGPVYKECISLDELHKPDAYLNHDVLTLRCRVWKEEADFSKSVHCTAQTNIKITKINYLWALEDLVDSDGIFKHRFERSTCIQNLSSEYPDIIMDLYTGESFGDDVIYFAISRQTSNVSTPPTQLDLCKTKQFAVYKIHLLDSNGRIVYSISGEVFLWNPGDIQTFHLLSKRNLLANEESYLPGGKLTLKCELSFSGNLEVESVEYGITNEITFNSMNPNTDSVSDGHELWKENLRQFYFDGEFSDLIVRTSNREFLVHKAILCAQSEVFRKMLSRDMKEKNSGVFAINDFNDDTVSKMLIYLYTNTLDDIDYALVKDLYFAADKYRIAPLQKICSKHLMDSMDTSNVCNILLLADQLRDQELNSAARDLIVTRPHEIMNSNGWRSLKETNVDLIVKTTEWMILNKLSK